MIIPPLTGEGCLPPGIHSTSLNAILTRFSSGSARREGLGTLLHEVVQAAGFYPTIKRILVWGSFVTDKPEPNDLDYSLVVGVGHEFVQISPVHTRFLVPVVARKQYGADSGFLVIRDMNLSLFVDRLEFIRHNYHAEVGVLEITLRGERNWDQ